MIAGFLLRPQGRIRGIITADHLMAWQGNQTDVSKNDFEDYLFPSCRRSQGEGEYTTL